MGVGGAFWLDWPLNGALQPVRAAQGRREEALWFVQLAPAWDLSSWFGGIIHFGWSDLIPRPPLRSSPAQPFQWGLHRGWVSLAESGGCLGLALGVSTAVFH